MDGSEMGYFMEGVGHRAQILIAFLQYFEWVRPTFGR